MDRLQSQFNFQNQSQNSLYMTKGLTIPAIPNDIVYCPYEVGEDRVRIVKAGENGDDIRTRVGVSFAQNGA
jgi:hypothetical protein